jgi:hypothetical protein
MDQRFIRSIITAIKSLTYPTATLFLLLASACVHPPDDLLTEKEVVAVMDKFDQGWKEKNAALVDSVLSPHYLYFTQSGKTFTRAALVATAGSSDYSLQTMERDNLTIQLEGHAAVVNTIWKGKGIYHGETFDDRQRCSVTIVKLKGQVRILAEHCTPIR